MSMDEGVKVTAAIPEAEAQGESGTLPASNDIREIKQRLEAVSKTVDDLAREAGIVPPQDRNEKNAMRSRGTAMLGLGLIGWKAGAILGAKIGFLTGGIKDRFAAFREFRSTKDLSDLFKIVRTMYIPETTAGAIIGSAIGIPAGAALGWLRGNRVKNPKDFAAHPFRSFATVLFGKDKEAPKSDTRSYPTPPLAPSETGQPDESKPWQSRIDESSKAAIIQR